MIHWWSKYDHGHIQLTISFCKYSLLEYGHNHLFVLITYACSHALNGRVE